MGLLKKYCSVRTRRRIFRRLLPLAAVALVCSAWVILLNRVLEITETKSFPVISRQEPLSNTVSKNAGSPLIKQMTASHKTEKPKELPKVPSQKTVPTKRTVPVKKTVPTKRTVPVKKTVPTKRTVPVKKTVPTKRTVPVKKTVPTKRIVPVKETAPTKGKVPVKPTPCKKRIAIFKPSPGFRHWREYVDLDDRFERAKKQNPSQLPVTPRLQCPEQQCEVELIVTIRHDLLKDCDGIIVNLDKIENAPRLQAGAMKALTSRTKWFLFAVESADRYLHWNGDFKDIMFQYSMTYHSESEVPHPYSRYVPNTPMDTDSRKWTEGKTGLVAWMSYSCGNMPWPRFAYVKKLQKLLPIDIYGKCGTLNCGKFLTGKPAYMNAPCMEALGKYKFYLALDNTECDEYITEKFWDNSLRAGSVPIVYGGSKAAYKRVAPPNSFIHISDFASIEKLAEYIRYLDKNDDKYNEYFAWRYKGHIEHVYHPLNVSDFMCRMVPWMNDDPVPFRRVKDTDMFQSCIHKPMVGTGVLLENWKPRN